MSSFLLSYLLAAHVRADEGSDRARAAQAYERGANAFREREYSTAADWFERANRLAPSSVAIVQAIRAHTEAHNILRAGSLALRVESDLTLSARARESVRNAIAAATARFLRVDVVCSAECTLAVDGAPIEAPSFFMEPNDEFEIVATFSNGTEAERVTGAAGEVRTVTIEAPPGAAVAEAPSDADVDLLLEEGANPYQISRIRFLSRPRATFMTWVAASGTVSGIATWSAIDARRSREDYRNAVASGTATTEQLAVLRHERDRDRKRTNGYYGFAAVAIGVTGLVTAFTDWTPHGDGDTEASVEVTPTSGGVTVTHRF